MAQQHQMRARKCVTWKYDAKRKLFHCHITGKLRVNSRHYTAIHATDGQTDRRTVAMHNAVCR